ncbi:hypothetical protein [Paraburkholderia sp. Clong3]|uniref:hypothetical protein n=1 Tax=Paraburkholderia sp. Clong3 TaxID=2991061 RepID=UPI003D23831E
MFKLNGYTFGERTIPVAVMAMLDVTRTRLNHDASGNIVSPKDGLPIFDSASIFLAGKITDRIGAFTQFTYSNYDHQGSDGSWIGHWASDNMDFRCVDRIIGNASDLILGEAGGPTTGVQGTSSPNLASWHSGLIGQYVPVPPETSVEASRSGRRL